MNRIFGLLAAALFCGLNLTALDRIAVAEPEASGVLSVETIAGITGILESKLAGGYEVVTRGALAPLMRERELQLNSGMATETLAQAGSVCGVRYLLVYTVSRINQQLVMSIMVVDCTTGVIDPDRRISFEGTGLEQLLMRLDNALDKIGLLYLPEDYGVKKLAFLPVSAPEKSLGKLYGDRLAEYLLKSGVFEVLNRDSLEAIESESAMVSHSLADFGQYAKIGQLSVADYLVEIAVTRWEHTVKESGAAAIAGTSAREFMTLEAQVRIFEVKTGKLIATESVTVRMRPQDIPSSVRRDWVEADFRNAMVERSIDALGALLLERLDPLLVALVDGDTVYLTRGAGAGVEAGQVYQIYNPGKPVVHPRTKQVLGVAEALVGEIQVVSSVPNMSTGRILLGLGAITDGAVCRLKPAEVPAPAPAAYPAAVN